MRTTPPVVAFLILLGHFAFAEIGQDQAIRELTFEETLNRIAKAGLSESDVEMLQVLKKESEDEKKIHITLLGGFNGDTAGKETLYKVTTGAELRRGIFPRELRFRAKTSFQIQNGKAQENVTDFLFNYDYHPSRYYEIYGFVERLRDSFLSIEERYEAGFGTKLNFEIGATSEGRRKLDILARAESEGRIRSSMPAQDELVRHFLKYRERYENVIRKDDALLAVGLAFSVFSDLEKAKISGTDLDGIQGFRYTIRPSFVLKPIDELTILGLLYWKLPLEAPRNTKRLSDGIEESVLDYRRDIILSAELKLSKNQENPDQLALEITFKSLYDNAPPFSTKEMSADGQEKSAESLHNSYEINIKFTW